MAQKVALFWFRRDLRLHDNPALFAALSSGLPVLPFFVFDTEILGKLPSPHDARLLFIHRTLSALKQELEKRGSTLALFHGTPAEAISHLLRTYPVEKVFANRDYEPYGTARDQQIAQRLQEQGVTFHTEKDHVIFEPDELLKADGAPYTVFTPYSRKWKERLASRPPESFPSENHLHGMLKCAPLPFLSLKQIGFEDFSHSFPPAKIDTGLIRNYASTRDLPAIAGTTRLGVHLRFGTISIRELTRQALQLSETFLNELIWRNFFISILAHFPRVVGESFKKPYDFIPWRNQEAEFERWKNGETGYPLVDAGMRELRATGFMHNRVRMVAASFLAKHLLIDWRWGEAYFAEKLLDYELASNNGNWQWAAGTGCDAAPYFRIFNPEAQQKRFDPAGDYIRRWVPEAGTASYPRPVVDHPAARNRALETYQKALKNGRM